MADRAREANDDQNVAGADFAHQSGELRPGSRSPRPVFLINCRTAGCAQLVGLRVGGLILRRDARVAQKTSLAGEKVDFERVILALAAANLLRQETKQRRVRVQ